MLLRLFLLFTLVPLVEVTLLVWIGAHTNWQVTVALIVLPGLLGAWLARWQGTRCVRGIQEQVARGELPAASMVDGLMIFVAGALLITPGLITDTAGLLLLVPPIRRWVRRYVSHRLQLRVLGAHPPDATTRGPDDEQIIDVESRPVDEPE